MTINGWPLIVGTREAERGERGKGGEGRGGRRVDEAFFSTSSAFCPPVLPISYESRLRTDNGPLSFSLISNDSRGSLCCPSAEKSIYWSDPRRSKPRISISRKAGDLDKSLGGGAKGGGRGKEWSTVSRCNFNALSKQSAPRVYSNGVKTEWLFL